MRERYRVLTGTVLAAALIILAAAEGSADRGAIVGWGQQVFGVDLSKSYVAVAGGEGQSLGLTVDGSIVAWGRNDHGQCDVPVPNQDFLAVTGGDEHSLGLKADGSVVAWGRNDYGQCNVPPPSQDFSAVVGGYSHSLGLKVDGSIVAWGRNDDGECNVPAPNAGFLAVAAGHGRSLAIRGTPVGVEAAAAVVPITQIRAVPNPTRSGARFAFAVSERNRVRLAIFDPAGRPVRVFPDAVLDPGRHEWTWDGRDGRGVRLTPGVYFYTAHGASTVLSGKIVIAP